MAKVTHVKKARKDIEGTDIKRGDSYYWWKLGIRFPKRYSKTRPKPSQLTTSEFLSSIYSVQEEIEAFRGDNIEEAVSMLETLKDEVENQGNECSDKHSNMPDSLQQGPTGELLEQRVSACEDLCSAMEEAAEKLRNLEDELKNDDEPDYAGAISEILGEIDFSIE